MEGTITLPLWLFVLLAGLAAWTLLGRLVLPGVRALLRSRVNRVIDEVNTRLDIELRPFQLTRRQVLIDRLSHDPRVMETIDEMARDKQVSRESLRARVERYAREIVPAFNAYVYFRVGYWLAKRVANRLYRVRIAKSNDASFRRIDPQATVVFVMNHRSNMDYVLVAFLIAERTALSYAVGEWARVWPLQTLIRSMGAFFVRRNSADALYRRVLERYVAMATREGVCQAVYPEGGLSRDGLMRAPKLGFLGYMLRDHNPASDRDIVFVPVGVNYDRTLEDRTLLLGLDPDAQPRGPVYAVLTTLRFIVRNLQLMITSNWRRLGYASVAFGEPFSVREFCAGGGHDLSQDVSELADHLMQRVAELIPVLPVPVVSHVLLANCRKALTRDDVLDAGVALLEALRARDVAIGFPHTTRRHALATALEMLVLRRLVDDTDGAYRMRADEQPILRYYANSLTAWLAQPAP